MNRLLRGEIPPGGRCDLRTLAAEAGVTRTGFYAKGGHPGPYQHLAEEFDRRLKALQTAGEIPDPRDAHIARLKSENTKLKERISDRDSAIDELTSFKTLAISQLAAQHDEIKRLRSGHPNRATSAACPPRPPR
ncbi:MAG: hypothetical protein JWN52_4463 [Actinomycetia bacterium]|nr:hypothetical protein [Actinomycetes bacterium]